MQTMWVKRPASIRIAMDAGGMIVFWQGLALVLGDAVDQSDTHTHKHITSNDMEHMEGNARLCRRH